MKAAEAETTARMVSLRAHKAQLRQIAEDWRLQALRTPQNAKPGQERSRPDA